MARKQKKAPKGLDGWVMTYGDMMSLLLCFFVLIVSFSSMQEAKFQEAAISLQGAFGVMKSPPTVVNLKKVVIPHLAKKEREDIIYEVRKLEQSLLDDQADREVEVTITEQGVNFRINAPFLFASGTADLKETTVAVLEKLDAFCEKFPYPLRIEGHTDSVPINTNRFPSNWDLSAARAVAVARHFQVLGIAPERMSAVGRGEFQPIATNDTAEGRDRNRRVEIFLMVDNERDFNWSLPLASEENEDG
ncbi:MAG: OmpA family protein [bacterium]